MTVKVEFAAPVGSGDFSWQDITSYVSNVDVHRGRDVETAGISPGACQVRLINIGRDFDPSTNSLYGGSVKPAGGLRITLDGTVIYTGFIRNWDFDYSIDGLSTATINAYDGFNILNMRLLDGYTPTVQNSAARINDVLTFVGWTDANVPSTAKATLVGGTAVATGTTAYTYLQDIEASEPGKLFIDKSGTLVFKNAYDSIYDTAYSYKRYNLSNNPSFESDTINWSYTSGTASIPRSTAIVPPVVNGTATAGTWALQIPAGSAVKHGFNGLGNTSYTFSFYAYATASANLTLTSYAYAGTASSSTATTKTITANSWQRLKYTWIAPLTVAGSAVTGFGVGIATDQVTYVDAVLIEQSGQMLDYFDGSFGTVTTTTSNGTTTSVATWGSA